MLLNKQWMRCLIYLLIGYRTTTHAQPKSHIKMYFSLTILCVYDLYKLRLDLSSFMYIIIKFALICNNLMLGTQAISGLDRKH